MVARRLLVILLVLLGVSTLAAALAPNRDEDDDEPTTTKAAKPPTAEEKAARGELFKVKVDANAEGDRVVPVEVGDQLTLQVYSRDPDQIEIPDFGLIETVTRDGPATFDILLERPGSYDVVRLSDGGRVTRLAVSEAQPE